MEGTSNYAKEVSLGSSATYFDKEHGESGFSGEAASGDDEGSEVGVVLVFCGLFYNRIEQIS